MALTPAETERLLTQHGEDILEIYGSLARIEKVQGQHTRALRDHDRRFDGMDERLERVDSQLGEVLQILRGRSG